MNTRIIHNLAFGLVVALASHAVAAAPVQPRAAAAPTSDLTVMVADTAFRKLGTLQGTVVIPLDGTLSPDIGGVVVYKSTTVKCGDTNYTVSTGNSGGKCGVVDVGGKKFTRCTDGKGNYAYANCGGCDQSGGTGSCTIKSQ